MMKGTVLVTGGAGYVGSHVVLALQEAGWKPVVLDDLSSGQAGALPLGVPLVVADVRDINRVAHTISAHRCGAVVHMAALSSLSDSFRDPQRYYSVNVEGTRAVAAALALGGAAGGASALLLSSTAAVYSAPRGMDALDEASPTAPVSPYGRSKLMAEWIVADIAAQAGLKQTALRYFNVAGADPAGRTGDYRCTPAHLFGAVAEAAVGLRPCVEVFGTDWPTPDGTCVRDYVHVCDVASAHVAVLAALISDGTTVSPVLNIARGRGASVLDVIRAAERVCGQRPDVVYRDRRAGDLARVVACADRIAAETIWTARHADLDRMMLDAIDWARRRQASALDRAEGG